MSDEMQNDDLDQSFWAEVDALRAMLDEEDGQQKRPQAPSFNLSGQSRPSEPCPNGQAGPDFQTQSPKHIRQSPPVFTPANIPPQREMHYTPPAARKARIPRRPSKGALITLYTIIVLELGAIAAVSYHWYAWIH